jgi:hypothetical protein
VRLPADRQPRTNGCRSWPGHHRLCPAETVTRPS